MQKNSCYTKLAQHFSKANQSFESLLETTLAILTNLQGKKIAANIFNFGGSLAAFSFATIK